jgi:hypothetical protein
MASSKTNLAAGDMEELKLEKTKNAIR